MCLCVDIHDPLWTSLCIALEHTAKITENHTIKTLCKVTINHSVWIFAAVQCAGSSFTNTPWLSADSTKTQQRTAYILQCCAVTNSSYFSGTLLLQSLGINNFPGHGETKDSQSPAPWDGGCYWLAPPVLRRTPSWKASYKHVNTLKIRFAPVLQGRWSPSEDLSLASLS